MQKTNPPQINTKELVRDASAQISEEGQEAEKHCINKDLVPRETESALVAKSNRIRHGAVKKLMNRHPDWDEVNDRLIAESIAVVDLAVIIACLTSPDRDMREQAKKDVRELVKLGKEA